MPPPPRPSAVVEAPMMEESAASDERLRNFFNRARLVRMRYAQACREDQNRQDQLRRDVGAEFLEQNIETHNMQEFDRRPNNNEAQTRQQERKE